MEISGGKQHSGTGVLSQSHCFSFVRAFREAPCLLKALSLLSTSSSRYGVLVERAKQLVNIAQEIENAFLSTLEKRDPEYYQLLRALPTF